MAAACLSSSTRAERKPGRSRRNDVAKRYGERTALSMTLCRVDCFGGPRAHHGLAFRRRASKAALAPFRKTPRRLDSPSNRPPIGAAPRGEHGTQRDGEEKGFLVYGWRLDPYLRREGRHESWPVVIHTISMMSSE